MPFAGARRAAARFQCLESAKGTAVGFNLDQMARAKVGVSREWVIVAAQDHRIMWRRLVVAAIGVGRR